MGTLLGRSIGETVLRTRPLADIVPLILHVAVQSRNLHTAV
ncbi:hypothetical protein SMD11_2139 [Streptomyces albireticuli]|uniref:Uncharacterized protein n=1 Tax=Streptomyces albireticuli TaxID=1940 RepID=A0A1Z2L0P8_9ACTN|nr:hypothetical protein SMD11_2139 [Streptomyces albireticuli]